VASPRSSKALAVLVYTVLRIALFAAVWLTIGAISLLVLDRQRGRAASVAAGFFGGINERIEASARAEDVDDEPVTPEAADSGEGQQDAEHEAVDKQ
jgi:hypothetical protein